MSADPKRPIRCAIYTRKSSEEGLDQSFNSLDAQREACEAFVVSQKGEGWRCLRQHYDDGGFSGGTMDRPALKRLLGDIAGGKIDAVVVYKVDRLTRSLMDFAKIIQAFDASSVSFVSVTQQFNTTTSMGRLTLNVLLSFAQFEREVTGERIRDKIAASKKKGMWMGGHVPFGYDIRDRKLVVNAAEARCVEKMFTTYLRVGCVSKLRMELDRQGVRSKFRLIKGRRSGGVLFSRGALYDLLQNRIYIGQIVHRGESYPGEHDAIVSPAVWQQVQARLAANRHAQQTQTRAAQPSRLAGLVYDERGNRFTPAHAAKGAKRYRYYVVRGSRDEGGPIRNVPADDLERVVETKLQSFIGSGSRLVEEVVEEPDARTTQRLLANAKNVLSAWRTQPQVELQAFLRDVISRVVIRSHSIEVLVRKAAIRARLLGEPSSRATGEGDLLCLSIDTHLGRCGLEVRLLVPGEEMVTGRPMRPLIKAIVRAREWAARLENGAAKNLAEIARQEGVAERYVRRILPCAFLAPDLVEAIVTGTQKPNLTLEKLRSNVPSSWVGQRQLFG